MQERAQQAEVRLARVPSLTRLSDRAVNVNVRSKLVEPPKSAAAAPAAGGDKDKADDKKAGDDSEPVFKAGDKLWQCEFCDTKNAVSVDEEEVHLLLALCNSIAAIALLLRFRPRRCVTMSSNRRKTRKCVELILYLLAWLKQAAPLIVGTFG